jgi:predicted kinase
MENKVTQELTISAGTLVVLSGLPGAGKSRLRNLSRNLPQGAWVSSDELRTQMLGTLPVLQNGKQALLVRQDANDAVFSVMNTVVSTRLRHGLTTVVDTTAINDAERKPWLDVAEQHGAPALVVIVDTPLEQCIANMANREDWVPEHVIRKMHQPPAPTLNTKLVEEAKAKGKTLVATPAEGFKLDSRFPYRVVSSDTVLNFAPPQVLSQKLDVVGDIHGLYDDMVELLANAGWTVTEGKLVHADPQRKLLFLGDLVDRGPHSVEVLELVKRTVEAGNAQCILGNHENKLVSFVETARKQGIEKWGSYANAETGMKMLKLGTARCDELVSFMKRMPAYLTDEQSKVAFVHGDIHRFDPFLSLKGDLVYGQSGYERGVDSDGLYEAGFAAGLNTYTVIRGHIPQTSPQSHIFSLENSGYQKGELLLLKYDQFLGDIAQGKAATEAFSANVLRKHCEFDFEAYSAKRFRTIRAMERLVTEGLARRYFDSSKMLRGYKYSKEVFWKAKWDESEWLLEARGIVLDASGEVVSYPFTKVFNYQERGTGIGLPDEMCVVKVDKYNGFLGVISPHPLKRGELLIHTQGSLDEDFDFARYIRDGLSPKSAGLIAKFFASRPMTLMFEVLHKEDPHIVEYDDSMMGLHLIGARGLNEGDVELTESELDEIGTLIEIRRPKWERTTWGAVKAEAQTCRHEGFMVRQDTALQEYILKLKSPYYLTTKFLGRLSEKKTRHLFGNPQDFKKHVDEEVYPVVDAVTGRFTMDEFLSMPDEQRVPMVRKLIEDLQ